MSENTIKRLLESDIIKTSILKDAYLTKEVGEIWNQMHFNFLAELYEAVIQEKGKNLGP